MSSCMKRPDAAPPDPCPSTAVEPDAIAPTARGLYDPGVEPPLFRIDEARFGHWVKNGAQPSDTVRELVQRAARNAAKTA